MCDVIKRNGSLDKFDIQKVKEAMRKAFIAEEKVVISDVLDLLALRVTADFQPKVHNNMISVEDIQDSVEKVLSSAGFSDVAKSYILYRKQREAIRNLKSTFLDYKELVNSYVNTSDWRVKENSTITYSVGGLILSNSGAITANYWLSEIYDKEIGDAHRNADLHLHDLSMLAPYCFTGDTRVKTLDGKNPTFKELVDNGVKKLWVFAFDKKNNKIVPTEAINPRITRKTNQLVEVQMADNTVIRCTPDHLFMLRDGTYREAKNLTPNTSLMPLYIGEKTEYVTINSVWINGKSKYLHRWVAENISGRILSNSEVVHHINGDKHDNRPENLEIMNDKEHRKQEIMKTMETSEWKKAVNIMISARNKSNEMRTLVSNNAKTRQRNEHGRFVSAFQYRPERDPKKAFYNHRVRKVKLIQLEEMVDVYDLTVPEYENFAIDGNIFVHNCAGWSLKQLIQEGLGGIPGKITSAPAKHLSSLCNQMVNFIGIMQNEWAGAQAFSSFDTYLAPFVRIDNLSYQEVKNCIQSFVFGVNTPSRWGSQAPFTNITLDWKIPNDLKDLPAIIGGKPMDFTYGDCQKEADMVNKAFIEVMIEGDANGRGLQYPIPTYSITKDFDWSETENNKLLFEMAAKYGTPYFSNYVNSDMEPTDVRSMCCRLRLDLRELRKKSGGFFGSGESTGSIGVVTLNLPRLAYLAENEADFYKRLDKLMDIAARSLDIKRKVLTKYLELGMYPYAKRYLGTFNNHFSTIGLVGMNEAGLNAKWLRKDLAHPETQQFARDVLNHMRERLSDYQEKYGDLFNLEATPAESTAYRLAKHDKERWSDIITASDGTPYYTNSSNLPVGYTEDVFEALDIQDSLQTLYTSGTVFHVFLGERLDGWKSAAQLVRKIAENYHIPYYTLSPTYSVCPDHGYIVGEVSKCPQCGKETEVYSRITGYYRPLRNWNDGKVQEFKERKEYDPDSGKKTAEDNLLFSTATCPNCNMAENILKQRGIQYKKIVVKDEATAELAKKYDIQSVPVLVSGGRKYNGVNEIRAFAV